MNRLPSQDPWAGSAVYSEEAQCQDCYKCLRHCPVKAIRVSDGHAVVIGERCIACGGCVAACPVGAKRVRNDLGAALAMLASGRRVALSLAPSFVSEFPGASPVQVATALRRLGFDLVSETALGAQEVSARLAKDLDATQGRLFLSTACPVAVDLVRKFIPEQVPSLTPVDSPLQAHARLLKALMGEDLAVVFAGPCIAKKLERDASPECLDVVLTFRDLHDWLEAEGIDPAAMAPDPEGFWPEPAAEGALFPVEGGMGQAIQRNMTRRNTRFLTVMGLDGIQEALGALPPLGRDNLFLELLACEGGCVRGPMVRKGSFLGAQMQVLDHAGSLPSGSPRQPQICVDRVFSADPMEDPQPETVALTEALARLGKTTPEDELNCGGCGYDTCRDLAAGMLLGRAEDRMCVSYLRRMAEKKANALFRTLPYGVVIVDRNLAIIESNDVFIDLMGPDARLIHEAMPGLSGARLEKFLPFAHRFQDELDRGEEIIRESHPCGDRTLSVSIFTVEPGRVVGAILLDVTETERRRQEVIDKAEAVIQGMMANVQEIAQSLGRNAARSEGILHSMIEAFSGPERRGGGHA